MFSSFVAKRAKLSPEALDERRKAFEIAHDNRKFEIGLFWQRSLFFWGFVGAALVGYGTSYGKNPLFSVAFGLFGFVCSFAWSLANRGSKYWQEYWEGQVNAYQHFATGDIFIDHTPKKSSAWDHLGPRRFSVSKLAMALSDYVLVLWTILIAIALDLLPWWSTFGEILQYALIGGTVCYCVYFAKNSNSED